MSITRDKELKIGIFTIVALALLWIGINFLNGINFLSSTTQYYAVYSNVEGLSESNPIKYKGVEVGTVGKISLLESQGVLVELNVSKKVQLKKGAEAHLMTSLTGTASVIIKNIHEHAVILHAKDTIRGITPKSLSDLVESTAIPLANHLDSIMLEFAGAGIILKKTIQRFDTTSIKINQILTHNDQKINQLMSNLTTLSYNLNGLTNELKPTLANFHSISDSLAEGNYKQMVLNIDQSLAHLNQVMEGLQKGQGTMGKLLTDDSLYLNLNHTMQSMDSLLIDLKAHPKRYVHFSLFGKKDKTPKK